MAASVRPWTCRDHVQTLGAAILGDATGVREVTATNNPVTLHSHQEASDGAVETPVSEAAGALVLRPGA